MGQLYDLKLKIEKTIVEKGLDMFQTKGRIALKTGMFLDTIRHDTPDDPATIAEVEKAASEALGGTEMKNKSIRAKVVFALIICLVAAAGSILLLVDAAFDRSAKQIGVDSLRVARETFLNMEQNDIKMMSSTLEGLMRDKEFQRAFTDRDRGTLLRMTSPLFQSLRKNYGITHWYFLEPEPISKCFLRVHKPGLFGDKITRETYRLAMANKSFGSGKELGKTAFALRVVHPYYVDGKLNGYMELGEEINHFLGLMTRNTGNEYALLIDKRYLDYKEWVSVSKRHGRPNTWNDANGYVVVDSTVSNTKVNYEGDFASIPDDGKVLDIMREGRFTLIKGIFPVRDVRNRKVGAIIVVKDITFVYSSLKSAKQKAVVMILIVAFIASFVVITAINRLIFKRLASMKSCITKVVGGDYYTCIKPSAQDEIGEFENLIENFRAVFVNLIDWAMSDEQKQPEKTDRAA